MRSSQARYVGCIPLDIEIPPCDRQEIEEVLRELNCFPVFLEESVLRQHYHGFCKKILWPVLHNSVNMSSWRGGLSVGSARTTSSRTVR